MPAANGADGAGSLRAQAETLRARNATLAERRHSALLELYALESRAARARARAAALRARLVELRAEQASAQTRLRIARATADRAQRELGRQLRTLYQEGEPDAIAILLGSDSLEEALTGLEGLQRSARQTDRVVSQARRARRETRTLTATLALRARALGRLTATANETAAALEAALTERRTYVRQLAVESELNAGQIASLESEAVTAQRRSQEIEADRPALPAAEAGAPSPVPTVAAAPAAPALRSETTPAAGGRTLTVESTGYALPGTTASGLPVGWGIVAVDPSVIPLGTKMTIPGYGEGVAADTGSAVRGLIIDLWFPTTAQALEWGRRTVTITIH